MGLTIDMCVAWYVADSVERDCTDSATDMTDAQPTSLQHDALLSFKDFIIGYPTQTGRIDTWLGGCRGSLHPNVCLSVC